MEKTYRPSQNFKPLFFQIYSDSYLMPLLTITAGAVEPSGTWLKTIPEFHVAPLPARGVSPEVLRAVVRGLEDALAATRTLGFSHHGLRRNRCRLYLGI
jgi:hypothetical protein